MTGTLRRPETVECFSGAEYAEEPRRFHWKGEWRTVRRVVSRARLPEGKKFLVEDGQGEHFVLIYWSEREEWTIRPGK